jgi:hypothetical protein
MNNNMGVYMNTQVQFQTGDMNNDSYQINWERKENGIMVAEVRFGIFDTKGRELGVSLVADPADRGWKFHIQSYEECIVSKIQSCRDGKSFGASSPVRHIQESMGAAMADCVKRCKTSYNKVKKVAEKNGGVYVTK